MLETPGMDEGYDAINVARAKAFFAELLGWEYETDDDGYSSIRNAGSPSLVAGSTSLLRRRSEMLASTGMAAFT